MLNKFAGVTGKLGYAISKTKGRMEIEFKPFEEERMKLIRKYGTPDENGNYSVSQDAEDFNNSNYYVEDASVRDYDLLKALFVERKEEPVIEEVKSEEGVEIKEENEAV